MLDELMLSDISLRRLEARVLITFLIFICMTLVQDIRTRLIVNFTYFWYLYFYMRFAIVD